MIAKALFVAAIVAGQHSAFAWIVASESFEFALVPIGIGI
jgi:uncharacterized membrane protein YgaE (UPF0421/DUF939 family)